MDATVVLRKVDNAPNPYVDGVFDDRAEAAKSVCDYFLNDADGKMSPTEAIDLMISLMRGHHVRCERRSVEFWLDTMPLQIGAEWTDRNAKKTNDNSDVESIYKYISWCLKNRKIVSGTSPTVSVFLNPEYSEEILKEVEIRLKSDGWTYIEWQRPVDKMQPVEFTVG